MTSIGIVGGSGYVGAELLRLCAGHPELEVAWASADTQAETSMGDLYPSLRPAYRGRKFERFDPGMAEGVDAVFLALPHGESQTLATELRAPRVVDLAADFRLRDPEVYARWYGHRHHTPELLGTYSYGLPELFREDVVKADRVAVPGCYPTAAALALAPLARAGLIELEGVIVDAASGVSGAGRAPKAATTFGTANEDFRAYGLLDHRHTPEMEQVIGAQLLFTPHLAPMTRGILATCYARPAEPTATSSESLLELLAEAYAAEPFVVVGPEPPSTKATWGSNSVHLSAHYDARTGWVVVLAALDNLVKGAAGQAVQCLNLMLGLDETTGLPAAGVYP